MGGHYVRAQVGPGLLVPKIPGQRPLWWRLCEKGPGTLSHSSQGTVPGLAQWPL